MTKLILLILGLNLSWAILNIRSKFFPGFALFGLVIGCGGSGGSTGPSLTSFGSFTAELMGAAQPPVITSASYGANATGIAGAQFERLAFTASGENTLADTKILFSTTRDTNYEVYSVTPDGLGLTRLTNSPGTDDYAVYSPNGSKIVFNSARDGNREIYVMNANGTGQTRLTNDASDDFHPTWSPDGTQIAFCTNRDGNYELYVMNADGTNQIRRTFNTAVDFMPSWSPDGTRLAYYSNQDGDYEIRVIGVNGSGEANITLNAEFDASPKWSPDGRKIVFVSTRDGQSEIYLFNLETGVETRVTNRLATDESPSFSPDGSRIIFSSSRQSNDLEIYSMNLDGSDVINISRNVFNSEVSPSWSGYLPRSQRTLVGPSGTFGTVCAGFVSTQVDDHVVSVLSFDTTTQTLAARAGARVTAETAQETNGTSLIMSVTTTTGLGTLKYAPVSGNGTPGTVTTFTMPTGATGALVSYSSATGLLATVLPYTATRGTVGKPKRNGTQITFEGSFAQIIDGEGKVTVPRGASSVTIDEQTGRVVSYR